MVVAKSAATRSLSRRRRQDAQPAHSTSVMVIGSNLDGRIFTPLAD